MDWCLAFVPEDGADERKCLEVSSRRASGPRCGSERRVEAAALEGRAANWHIVCAGTRRANGHSESMPVSESVLFAVSGLSPVGFCSRRCPALRRPGIQIRHAISHPVAEAMEGGPVPAHSVAVQRAARQAEIGRRTRCVEEATPIVVHAAPVRLPDVPELPRAGAATVGGAGAVFKAHGKEKSGDIPPSGPMRTLPRDGADTARPQVVTSPPGARRPRPRRPRPKAVRRGNSGM